MQLTLKRISSTIDGVLGVLLYGVQPVCLTLEEEWKNNAKNISCIPAGTYECRKVTTPKHGSTFEVTGVPGRSAVLIHTGNTEVDTEGCILPGMEFGEIEAIDDDTGIKEMQVSVLRSTEAYRRLMKLLLNRDTFKLEIKWC